MATKLFHCVTTINGDTVYLNRECIKAFLPIHDNETHIVTNTDLIYEVKGEVSAIMRIFDYIE